MPSWGHEIITASKDVSYSARSLDFRLFIVVVKGIPDRFAGIHVFVGKVEEAVTLGAADLKAILAVSPVQLLVFSYHFFEFGLSHIYAAGLGYNVLKKLGYIVIHGCVIDGL